MRGRTPAIAAFAMAVAVAALAAWRAVCVLAGPDIDTDAYAHHMIARAILADPRDLAVHWVWLPLFHYLQVPLIALGGTMNDVRWVNLVFAAAVPIVLFGYVRRTTRPGSPATSADVTALLAALFAAACPIAMQMGTTAQSEPLFALLALAIAITYEQRRYVTASALLGVAVVVRYEAWAILATAGAVVAVEQLHFWALRRRGRASEAPAPLRWLMLVVPAVPILVWAVLRRPVDGRWFGFLGDTHEFASQAVVDKSGSRGIVGLTGDALYYPVFVAVRVLGPVAFIAPFGVVRTWRQQGPRFVLVLTACLAFVSLTWVQRSSLGLDRHFVAAVALYATFAAQGIAVIAESLARRIASRAPSDPIAQVARRRRSLYVARGVVAVLALGSLFGLCVMLGVWMGFWRGSIERGWPERTALGAYLRTLPSDAPIFCDDATLEILSGVDRRRFDRHWIDDPTTWTAIGSAAHTHGVAYVATWRRKLVGHEAAGEIVFHATDAPDDPAAPNVGVAVMRVSPDSDRAAR
jgi:hypothetical protein